MPRQTTVAVTVASLLGIAAGGLIFWKLIRRQKHKSCVALNLGRAVQEREKEDTSEENFLSLHSSSTIPWVEKILGADVVVISEAEQWNEVEPFIQKVLVRCPVLGIDCLSQREEGSACVYLATGCLQWFLHYSSLAPADQRWTGSSKDFAGHSGRWWHPESWSRVLGRCLQVTSWLRCHSERERGPSVSSYKTEVLPQNGLSLKALSESILSYQLDKSFHLRCSNWEEEELTPEQVAYAARDAQVSVALFLHLLNLPFLPAGSKYALLPGWEKVLKMCQGLADVPFKGINRSSFGDDEITGGPEKKRNFPKSVNDGHSPVNQQSKDPRKLKRKPLGIGYSVRKSPLYDNCFLHAPDGQPLCTCDRKKAQWYLDKGIGELVSMDPFIVKLQFEPSGRPESKVDYYLTVKENLCVVCGKRESYIRKNIVPHEYRKHFPIQMKDHNSHDVLLLCTSCHAISNYYDNHLKQQLAEEFGAPIGCEEGVRLLEDPIRRQVRSGARALLNADSLPHARKEELLQVIKDYFDSVTVSPEMLQEAAGLETRICNENYMPHGLKVVQCFSRGGLRSLMQLERRWRQHFLDVMQPRYLPTQWSVSHNHEKLIQKYGEHLQVELS
ncbi:exonuclease 3'-5' domain-containing protein 2 isoform X2 [Podarcis raffonei]|uniref:exonuclease 3'-5' domain-containing protein 2 isoform X2 n=1 Tax=Podarcis raffonei TaxID=65483 RepID=UPI0023290AEC|nr:exonuclease 3'-5' domain-containing protein 2 isoform X2 [Podarcis raffonei]